MDHPLVVMGVSGSGKTTIARALSERLRVPFEDADDLHPEANVAKMRSGTPLTDEDRWPWLEVVGEWLADHADGGVIACSALKRRYRDQLRHHCHGAEFLLLHGDPDLLLARLTARSGHYMPPSLLTSQLETLEPLAPDENGVVVDVGGSVEDVVAGYLRP